jgi:hypothetical protein
VRHHLNEVKEKYETVGGKINEEAKKVKHLKRLTEKKK